MALSTRQGYVRNRPGRPLLPKGLSSACIHRGGTVPPSNGGLDAGPLLPELAQYQFLRVFELVSPVALPGSIPVEWGLQGAFPNLKG